MRDARGRYDTGMDTMCVCRHARGEHAAAAPHDCLECACNGFVKAGATSGEYPCNYCNDTGVERDAEKDFRCTHCARGGR